MVFRVAVFALTFNSRCLATCNSDGQCSINEEESVSTLQVQHDVANFSDNAECMHFYTHDCGLPLVEAPGQIDQMRSAFVKCCIKIGNYDSKVCQPFMEQIFQGHEQPSAVLCSKLVSARTEHHRFAQLLQRKTLVDSNQTALTSADLDLTVNRKLGFGPAQKNFACAENWEQRLKRASHQKNVNACKRKCEFSPECEAISFTDETCVLCGTPTMVFRNGWTTYVKQGTTREAQAHCRRDSDCDYYPGCNTYGGGGWEFMCFRKGNSKRGRCVNRNQHSRACRNRADDEMPVPGHWCLDHHLFRVCVPKPKEDKEDKEDDDDDN